jgi:uncharacterized protein (DUF4213/DUF364 family)
MLTTAALFDRLLADLPDAPVADVVLTPHWTAVAVRQHGTLRCGIASAVGTWREPLPAAARPGGSASALAALIGDNRPIFRSLALATINALLPVPSTLSPGLNSREWLARLGAGSHVVMVGHFPFADQLRPQVGTLSILEQEPQPGDHPTSHAPDLIPAADLLAITAMTLVNDTLDGLMALRRPGTPTVLIGPSAPLTPLLFETGITHLAGAVITRPADVLAGLHRHGSFRQLRHLGAQLVTWTADAATPRS